MLDVKWKDAVRNAKHFIAIGQNDVHLFGKNGDYPWEYAVSAEPGGTHRLDISTSIYFTAKHPSGLSFRWSFDIESRDANGAGCYKIDTAAISKVLSKIPPPVKKQLSKYFTDAADAVEKRGEEYLEAANKQFGDANTLRSFGR